MPRIEYTAKRFSLASQKVIDELIQEAIANEIDGEAWDTSKKAEDKARAELQTIADRWKDED